MANSEDASDKAFAELFELFSKPIKSPQKAYRTYQLTFENGESQRSLLISSILIALKNSAFAASYKKHKKPVNLATSLVKTVTDELKGSDIPKEKVENLSHAYGFIQTHTALLEDPSFLQLAEG